MKCPHCDQPDPEVTVLKDEQLIITGEGQISAMKQKTDVQVECSHCQAHFLLEFQVTPAGLVLDLS
jgi:hypothetical protein